MEATDQIEDAMGTAAQKVSEATDIEEAERWQAIVNQNTAALAEIRVAREDDEDPSASPDESLPEEDPVVPEEDPVV